MNRAGMLRAAEIVEQITARDQLIGVFTRDYAYRIVAAIRDEADKMTDRPETAPAGWNEAIEAAAQIAIAYAVEDASHANRAVQANTASAILDRIRALKRPDAPADHSEWPMEQVLAKLPPRVTPPADVAELVEELLSFSRTDLIGVALTARAVNQIAPQSAALAAAQARIESLAASFTAQAGENERLKEALGLIAGKNDLSGVADDMLESAARNALYECELLARAALEPERVGDAD